MKFVYNEHKAPSDFEEHLSFSVQMPYTIRIKTFPTEDLVPIHYGKTIEILFCENLSGQVRIQNRIYPLSGEQVFVIPPYTIHSNDIPKCDGRLYVLKVSFDDMEKYLDFLGLMESAGTPVRSLAHVCPESAAVRHLIYDMIANDGNFVYCIGCLAQLFALFGKYKNQDHNEPDASQTLRNTDLCKLINWTQQNFRNHISLEDVAKLTGYSKNYFCKRFRETAGITYFTYLNSVRIENACLLLQKGTSVNDACYESGFEDLSYFIHTFKKVHDITPKQYAQRFQSHSTGYSFPTPDWSTQS